MRLSFIKVMLQTSELDSFVPPLLKRLCVDMMTRAYVVVSGNYGVFVPRAKLTNREACVLAHMIKEKDWEDNIEVKKVHQFSDCSVFGETAMYSNSARDAIRNASVVAMEDSVVVAISKEEYLVCNC